MATEVATLMFKADTKEIGQAVNALQKLNKQGKITDATLKSFEKQLAGIRDNSRPATRGLGNLGRGAGQAGIQVQQLVGQIQAGTNPMLALSQQAADLGIVLGLPLVGAVAGLAASLGMVLLPALFNVGRGLDDLIEIADDLNIKLKEEFPLVFAEKLAELKEEASDSEETLRKLNKQLEAEQAAIKKLVKEGEEDAEVRGNRTVRANVHREAVANLSKEIQQESLVLRRAQAAIERFTNSETKSEEAARKFTEKLVEQAETFEKTPSEILAIEAAKHGLNRVNSLELDILMSLLEAKEDEKNARDKVAKAKKDEADAQRKLNAELTAEREEQSRQQARIRARELGEEREAAESRAFFRRQEAEEAARIQKEQSEAQARIKAEEAGREAEAAESRKQIRAAEDEARRLGLIDVEQSEIESFARRLELQKQVARDRNLSEQQRAEAQRNIEAQKNDFIVKNTSDALNALGQINSSAFKAAKAYNIGQAIMSTFTGASKALELPFPFNIAAAGAVIATGLAQVQTIRAQTYSGRALGGQVRGGESYVVGERGPEILSMGAGQSGTIIPNNRIQAPNQVTNKVANINFNISTVDARGFDSLLQSRRGQIVTIVNQAMNDRGTRGVI